MSRLLSRFIILAIFFSVATAIKAQQPGNPTIPMMPKSDSTKKNGGPANGPKPYKEVITSKAVSDAGLFWVHKVEDKYYFEIPDSLFNRDILVVNRISKAGAGMRSGGFFWLWRRPDRTECDPL